ncbi:hypothetical protein SO802_034144 [Lithocarpus litseifolius]|uniref:Flavin-containing monooxygenase n=1 Tax=Lithocarpus litseifolius TaxID=425828 RepID=A0AAW2BIJ7_9ROSI
MGFRCYPFVAKDDPDRDPRRYPGHQEVLWYLQDFTREFRIDELVRFETEVVRVRLVEEEEKWKIKSKQRSGEDETEIFDAVVICNGHYTEPRVAQIPGINEWPGKEMHSHNYRVPEPFRDQVVVLIGSSASAVDISRDIAGVAKEVHVAARSVADETSGEQSGYDNMWLHSMIESVRKDGTVFFQDGSFVHADIILHCTGYKYHFPFLETNGIVNVDDNRVGPLYKHVFPPALAPCPVAAPGISSRVFLFHFEKILGHFSLFGDVLVVPFPMFEFQSKWIAGVLSNRFALPTQEKMMEDVEAFYSSLEASGVPKRYTHNMGSSQFEYNNWLAAQCGCPANEDWRVQMYNTSSKNKRARPESYRDDWEDHHLVLQACEDFRKYASHKVSDRSAS